MDKLDRLLQEYLAAEMPDVSPRFRPNEYDRQVAIQLIALQQTPLAILRFAQLCNWLTDHSYWYFLGTLWVGYSGLSDLRLWKRLFGSSRPHRAQSLMKPSEQEAFGRLPQRVTAYRAHRPGESDWISYTLSAEVASRFALERGVTTIAEYVLKRADVLALFLRRDEQEVLMLMPSRARKVRELPVDGGCLERATSSGPVINR